MSPARLAVLAAVVFAGALVPRTAAAQCADGSPPPCRATRVASAPRRVDPPLDDRTWIVVPFDNLARAADIDWLRDASVNLLYLDMSRWRDIRVIDDERVADLIRETPGASAARLSLEVARTLARRAGAGRLVMGDLLKVGSRTAVTAKVYDTRTGNRVRSVREETAVQDSVIALFGKLAQRILNVAPPQGTTLGAVGTTRVDAYQEYLAGVTALNRFGLDEARTRLARAIELDSTFALAHFKMSNVIGWSNPGDPAQRRHAEAAARLMAGLPARERGLITGQLHASGGEWTDACQTFASLVAKDSMDVEALYGLGDCLYHDQTVEPVDGDTTRYRFRANWDRSIRAFQRVLELDPQYHLAYQHVIDALASERHSNATYCVDGRCRVFTGFLVRRGDTLVSTPIMMSPRADTGLLRRQAEEYHQSRSRRRNLEHAEQIVNAWIAAAPGENRARLARVSLLVAQGNVADADAALKNVRSTGILIEDLRNLLWRMEVAYKLGNGTEAARLYDSARTANIPLPGAGGLQFGNAISGYGPAFGRLVEWDSLLRANSRGASPNALRYQQLSTHATVSGMAHDSLPYYERWVFDTLRQARGARSATTLIVGTLGYALRMPRTAWPGIDTTVTNQRLAPAIALMRGDTAALRRAAMKLDSAVHSVSAMVGADSGYAVIAADAYLLLGDSAQALHVLQVGLDSAAAHSPYFPLQSSGYTAGYFAPRMMLMRADLAAARGSIAEARTWYRRFIDTWDAANPELQPAVQRARQSLAALPGS